MSTHNLRFEQKYEKCQSFSFENFSFSEVKFSIYLNRRVFVIVTVVRTFSSALDEVCAPFRNRVFLFFIFRHEGMRCQGRSQELYEDEVSQKNF